MDGNLIDSGELIEVARFANLEEAEEVGAQLIAQGIRVRLGGRLRNQAHTTLFVSRENAERAKGLIDLRQQVLDTKEPFHPCPQCGAEDPIWFGKRKWWILLAVFATFLILINSPWFRFAMPAVLIGLLAFAVGGYTIPEFECARCHHRWSKERKPEPD